jgi:hypothetical protein
MEQAPRAEDRKREEAWVDVTQKTSPPYPGTSAVWGSVEAEVEVKAEDEAADRAAR